MRKDISSVTRTNAYHVTAKAIQRPVRRSLVFVYHVRTTPLGISVRSVKTDTCLTSTHTDVTPAGRAPVPSRSPPTTLHSTVTEAVTSYGASAKRAMLDITVRDVLQVSLATP